MIYSEALVRAWKTQPQDVKSALAQNAVCQWALTSVRKKLYLMLTGMNLHRLGHYHPRCQWQHYQLNPELVSGPVPSNTSYLFPALL